ncbi:Ubiquitin carboxyl-terminal hydrolase BAP1 [Eufriesea mexicana]|uniref:Ubiquitin carboxyl-terminal hydrolase BAP1 n=1 Tax=Eufriesea mexicana TaxID=516756 RepID=A0A310SBC1_9HYME|nr:Ubiquitin carboxyl-terminal hydrolase BAP1 [Eufriesea mexicana]
MSRYHQAEHTFLNMAEISNNGNMLPILKIIDAYLLTVLTQYSSYQVLAWGWNSGQSSPTSTKDFKKFVVIRVSGDEKNEAGLSRSLGNININGKRLVSDSGHLHKKVCLSGEVRIPHARVKTSNGDTVIEEKKVEKIDPKLCSKYPELFEPHTFAPKDLLALLKNLEHEISICETSLKDENDKRNKYKIDDCRRTHNYDEFICTFLSMLAQQGKLAELVQQHLTLKKHTSVSVNRVHRIFATAPSQCCAAQVQINVNVMNGFWEKGEIVNDNTRVLLLRWVTMQGSGLLNR